MVQVQVCWYKGQTPWAWQSRIVSVSSGLAKRQPVRRNTTILGFAEGAMQKRSDLTDDKKTVQNSFVQGFWHMMNEFTVRLADANSVEEHLCLRSPKHCHQTGDQNPWTKWPGGPSDVMPVKGKAGSCPKQKSTIMRTPGYGSKMIHPLGYRMIRIMIYALLTCHN